MTGVQTCALPILVTIGAEVVTIGAEVVTIGAEVVTTGGIGPIMSSSIGAKVVTTGGIGPIMSSIIGAGVAAGSTHCKLFKGPGAYRGSHTVWLVLSGNTIVTPADPLPEFEDPDPSVVQVPFPE